jgi:hypothetical protein
VNDSGLEIFKGSKVPVPMELPGEAFSGAMQSNQPQRQPWFFQAR